VTLLLDTDTCIHMLREHSAMVRNAKKHSPMNLAVAALTRFEFTPLR